MQCIAVRCSVCADSTGHVGTEIGTRQEIFANADFSAISVAVWCSVLQCVAVCCSVMQKSAHDTRHSLKLTSLQFALQCVAVCCSVLQCVSVCCSVLQCVAEIGTRQVTFANANFSRLQQSTSHCSTVQHTAAHCNTLQHTATHYNTPWATLAWGAPKKRRQSPLRSSMRWHVGHAIVCQF